MRRRLALLAALCLAVAANSSAGEKKDKQAEGLALINRARELSDIRAPGSPPFRLRARVRLLQDKQSVQGTYVLIWLSPSQWREELALPGFNQLRIGGEGSYWVRREPLALPWVVYQLLRTLAYTARPTVSPEERVEKIRNRKQSGASLTCVELASKPTFVLHRELCFEMGSSTLSRVRYGGGNYEFNEQAPWGTKAFPHSLRYVEGSKPIAEIDVEELVQVQSADASWFRPPQRRRRMGAV